MGLYPRHAGRYARRYHSWRWRLGALALFLTVTGCLNDALAPSARPGVRLDIRAQVSEGGAGEARTVTIEVFYRRSDESLVRLPSSPAQLQVTAGGATEQPVLVHLADCLADRQRMDAKSGGCHLTVTLSLLDDTGEQLASETTDVESAVSPGQTITVAPVALLAPDLVNISGPAGLCVGETQSYTAQAYAGDLALAGRTFTWSSSQPLVATVDENGLVTAVGAGTTTITATTGGVSAELQITIVLPAADIAPVSGDGSECTVGSEGDCAFIVRVTDTGGGPAAGVEVLWSSPASGHTLSTRTNAEGLSTAPVLDTTSVPGTYTQIATLVKTGKAITFTYHLINIYGLTILNDSSSYGTGIVTVSTPTTPTTPNLYSCTIGVGGSTTPASCQVGIRNGTSVTLTATADPYSAFGGWSGACSGESATCTVSMDSALTVTAYFFAPNY